MIKSDRKYCSRKQQNFNTDLCMVDRGMYTNAVKFAILWSYIGLCQFSTKLIRFKLGILTKSKAFFLAVLMDFLQTGPSHMLKKLSKGIFSGVLSSMPSFIAYHTPEWKSHAKIGFGQILPLALSARDLEIWI